MLLLPAGVFLEVHPLLTKPGLCSASSKPEPLVLRLPSCLHLDALLSVFMSVQFGLCQEYNEISMHQKCYQGRLFRPDQT